MFGRFAYLGQLGHLAMITVPIGSVVAGLNVGALAHQLGKLFPAKWVPDISSFGVNPWQNSEDNCRAAFSLHYVEQ